MYVKDGVRYPTVTGTGVYGFYRAYRFLSNFHSCNIIIDGSCYASAEHAYMACKTVDPEEKSWFQRSIPPAEAKKLGRRVTLRREWDTRLKLPEMERVVTAKFAQNTDLRKQLLATGDKFLEETNYWKDTYWGVCNGFGENNLGKVLTRVRRRMALVGPVEERAIYEEVCHPDLRIT